MEIFYLLVVIVATSYQSVAKKFYSQKKSGKGVYLFSMFSSVAAMLFFMATSCGVQLNVNVLPYALCFGIAYGTAVVCSVLAVANGSLSISSLIISYSLMIPMFYGLIFLNDPISTALIIGIVLLVISLFLINKKGEGSKVTTKWIVSLVLGFVGNGMCSVIQKIQQDAFDGAYKNEFMIMALAVVAVILGVCVLFKEKGEVKTVPVSGWVAMLSCGVMNGIVNLLIMVLYETMPVSVVMPLISAGGIIITYIISKFVYKEELTRAQFAGFVIGVASIVFLNM